jgi:transcriptional regulator with XRE-family HTH domain
MTEETGHECGHQAEITLGQNVARLRQALGLSMRDLRARSQVSISIISRVEHGYGTSVSVAARLAGGLGVLPPELLENLNGTAPPDAAGDVADDISEMRGDYARMIPRQRASTE